jgi:hypothetical protein
MKNRATPGVHYLSIACIAAALFAAATPARAQTDFTGLKAQAGDRVWVTRASGATISGTFGPLSPSSITVNGETIPYEPGLKIAREGDRLLNGFIIGAAIGVLAGTTIGAEACLDSPMWHCAVGGAAVWGGIGALADWLHKGRTQIFEAPRSGRPSVSLVPSLGLERQAVGLVLSF